MEWRSTRILNAPLQSRTELRISCNTVPSSSLQNSSLPNTIPENLRSPFDARGLASFYPWSPEGRARKKTIYFSFISLSEYSLYLISLPRVGTETRFDLSLIPRLIFSLPSVPDRKICDDVRFTRYGKEANDRHGETVIGVLGYTRVCETLMSFPVPRLLSLSVSAFMVSRLSRSTCRYHHPVFVQRRHLMRDRDRRNSSFGVFFLQTLQRGRKLAISQGPGYTPSIHPQGRQARPATGTCVDDPLHDLQFNV